MINSFIPKITTAKYNGNVRVYTEDSSEVGVEYIDDGEDKIILQGNFGNVIVQTDTEIAIVEAHIDKLVVESTKSNITVQENSRVNTLEVQYLVEESTIKIEGWVTTLTTYAAKTLVEGEGRIYDINVEDSSDTSIVNISSGNAETESTKKRDSQRTETNISTTINGSISCTIALNEHFCNIIK